MTDLSELAEKIKTEIASIKETGVIPILRLSDR